MVRILDPVAWKTSSGTRSTRHIVGYTGLPPEYARARALCGRPIPVGRIIDAEDVSAPCARCRAMIERYGPEHFEEQQRRWMAIERQCENLSLSGFCETGIDSSATPMEA